MTDRIYAHRRHCPVDPLAVLIGDTATDLTRLAARFKQTAPDHRPLLMHPFLPRMPRLDFVSLGLPRPVPILPLLIRRRLYIHQPNAPIPDLTNLLILLAEAFQKQTALVGVDLDRYSEVGKKL